MFPATPEEPTLYPILIGSALILFGFMVWRDEQKYFMYAVMGAVVGFLVGVILSLYAY